MENKFTDYFSRISPLTDEEKEAITNNMTTLTCQKGDFLLKEGQISFDTYFVLAGCVYYIED